MCECFPAGKCVTTWAWHPQMSEGGTDGCESSVNHLWTTWVLGMIPKSSNGATSAFRAIFSSSMDQVTEKPSLWGIGSCLGLWTEVYPWDWCSRDFPGSSLPHPVRRPSVAPILGLPQVCVNPTPVFVLCLQEAMLVSLSPAACCVSLRPTTAEAAGVQKVWAAVSSPLETWCVTALRATRGRTTRVSKKVWPHSFPPFSPFPPDLSVS